MNAKIAILAVVLLAAGAGGGLLYAGVYNVAATAQHTAPVYWLMDYAMRRSVKSRGSKIDPPPLDNMERIRSGLVIYREKCLQCHGAPGVAPQDFALGLNPPPASLVATAREWRSSDVYWAIRNGIKMTGMPAWQYRLSDEEIWDVVAFVQRLPFISPAQFEQWNASIATPGERTPKPAVLSIRESTGDPEAGKRAIDQYLCATCHRIPGIVGASKHVGPPLNGMADRKYIAGVLPNTPENMIRWLQHPKQIDPLTAMPGLHVADQDARDIAAYLSTLKDEH